LETIYKNKPTILKKYSLILIILILLLSSCWTADSVPSYKLTAIASPEEGGKLTVSPSSPTYKPGEVVTLIAEPNKHWLFQQWEGAGSGQVNPLKITMDSDKTVQGIFIKKDYPLTIIIKGQGIVEEKVITDPSGKKYPQGTVVELTPKAKEGWVFESWEGDLSGADFPQRIMVDKEMNITANFLRKEYEINFTILGEGTVEEKILTSPSGKNYPNGTVVQLIPKPNEGWIFESWGGDLAGTDSPQNITVDSEKNVTLNFVKDLLSVKLNNTVWVGDENYMGCDCGFAEKIAFKDSVIFELDVSEFYDGGPPGCYPYNPIFRGDLREGSGEILDYKEDANKLSFTMQSMGKIFDHTEYITIEMIDTKLKVTSIIHYTSSSRTWVNEYDLLPTKFDEYCK